MRYLFLFLFSITSMLYAQTSNYDIDVLGKDIGDGLASKVTAADGSTIYTIKSLAAATVFFKDHSLETEMIVQYKDEKMNYCKLDKVYNGEQEIIEVKYNDGKYQFSKDDVVEAVAKDIKFTSTEMFFKEPIDVSEVYVERLNMFATIEKIDTHTYKTDVDGSVNIYYYENGELVKFKIKTLINIVMNKV